MTYNCDAIFIIYLAIIAELENCIKICQIQIQKLGIRTLLSFRTICKVKLDDEHNSLSLFVWFLSGDIIQQKIKKYCERLASRSCFVLMIIYAKKHH